VTNADVVPVGLRARVEAWIADDPDAQDRAELTDLLRRSAAGASTADASTAEPGAAGPGASAPGAAGPGAAGADAAGSGAAAPGAAGPGAAGPGAAGADAALAELADRFVARLAFGTAGLRGAVAAGPNRMNRAVVRSATAAVARWLREHRPGAAEAGVVIGCDARHRSEDFASEAAGVLAGAGFRVHLLTPRRPTPLLAFAVRWLGAAAGIMITASHNPPADNGYKLYLGDGAQIIPPADSEIEAAIQTLGPLAEVALGSLDGPLVTRHGDDVTDAYLRAVCALSPATMPGRIPAPEPLRVVYTPLHGVAAGLAMAAMRRAGYPAPHVVAVQAEPDPDFPTVAFPNPEQPGALDLAVAEARRIDADLVLANDPDGDRLAVAVPDQAAGGGWRTLTGDELGALLGAYVLDRTAAEPKPGTRLVVATIVSSTLLSKIAARAGARYAQTLTGFKWIVRAGERAPGSRFVFGYEEALGYVVGDVVRDKDGIGAALATLSLATSARSAGASLVDTYDALEVAHGVHLTAQVTLETAATADIMVRLRAAPPDTLAGTPVVAASDLSAGSGELPPADVLIYGLPGARVVIRPSGTEPKLKAYLEVVQPVAGGDLAVTRAHARERLGPLRQAVRDLLTSYAQRARGYPRLGD